MRVKNNSKVRQLVEGFGHVDPNMELTVPDEVGKSLTTGGKPLFQKVSTATKSKRAAKQKRAEKPKTEDSETQLVHDMMSAGLEPAHTPEENNDEH